MEGVCYGTYDGATNAVYTAHDAVADTDTNVMASTSSKWTYS
jgi:hypothetical protein